MTQAATEPSYGLRTLEMLKQGGKLKDISEKLINADSGRDWRQIAFLDQQGNIQTYTGKSVELFAQNVCTQTDNNVIVMGNTLSSGQVCQEMLSYFLASKKEFPERLLEALMTAEKFGGQVNGKMSAALCVKRSENPFHNIDLRVDYSPKPFKDLEKLFYFQWARNQIRGVRGLVLSNQVEQAISKLDEIQIKTKGWTSVYPQVIELYLMLDKSKEAAEVIHRALKEEPKWSANLPKFYFLKGEIPSLRDVFKPDSYGENDWYLAADYALRLGKLELCEKFLEEGLKHFPNSTYLFWVQGRYSYQVSDLPEAIDLLKTCVHRDFQKTEASQFLKWASLEYQGESHSFQCPPCGCALDNLSYSKFGKCKDCGMDLELGKPE